MVTEVLLRLPHLPRVRVAVAGPSHLPGGPDPQPHRRETEAQPAEDRVRELQRGLSPVLPPHHRFGTPFW